MTVEEHKQQFHEQIERAYAEIKPGEEFHFVLSARPGEEPGAQNEVFQEKSIFGIPVITQNTATNPRADNVDAGDYEIEAARTDLDKDGYLDRAAKFFIGPNCEYRTPGAVNPAFHLLHALLGIVSEAGELADQLKRHIIYEQPLDRNNVLEEIGDIEWYLAKGARCMDSNLEEVRDANIAKLRKRFPEKFTNEQAVQRDATAERQVLDDHFDEEETRG